jgi:glutamate 5-kinase
LKQPVVVKLGSSLVADARGRLRRSVLRARGGEIAEIVGSGTPVCVVSSGAIALGLARMGLERRPRSLPRLQAASALGQTALQRAWEDALGAHGVRAGQVLLTAAEIADRRAYVNVRNALGALFGLGAVPVVNENDATATDEISFGDNDALAAQVAVLSRARLLVLLTAVEGVFTGAPGSPGAALIADGAAVRDAVFGPGTAAGRGGMESKVLAAELAAAAGIPTVIAAGTGESVLPPIVAGEQRGTRFAPAATGDSAFKLWLRFGKRIAGRIRVDEGARRAVAAEGRSLLAVGVLDWTGRFKAGDGVELVGPDGEPFGRGISSVDAEDLAGRPANVEAVHRDRLVLLPPEERSR